MTARDQLPDQLEDLGDVPGRGGLVGRRQHVDRVERLVELAAHQVGDLEPRPALGLTLGQDLVVDVGDVADERDVVARGDQPAPQHVEVHRRAHVTHVGLALHGQATHVDARLALLERDEVADVAGRGVVEPESHPPIVGAERGPSDSTQSKRTARSERRSELRPPGKPPPIVGTWPAASGTTRGPAPTARSARRRRRRDLDVAVVRAGLRLHRAGRLVVGDDPARHLDRGGRPGARPPGLARARRTGRPAVARRDGPASPVTPRWTPTCGDRATARRPTGCGCGCTADRRPSCTRSALSSPRACGTARRRHPLRRRERILDVPRLLPDDVSPRSVAAGGARPRRSRWCCPMPDAATRHRHPGRRPRDLRPGVRRHRQLVVQHRLGRALRPGTPSSPGSTTCVTPSGSSTPGSPWWPASPTRPAR